MVNADFKLINDVDDITQDDIYKAYLKLKSSIYYDKNYFYKKDLANFEDENNLNDKTKELLEILNSANTEQELKKYLNKIDFYVLPKTINHDFSSENCNVLCNAIIQDKYEVENINYFIKLPLELQILDVLWVMKIGKNLQQEVNSDDAYANILDIDKNGKFKSQSLFKKYFNQYSVWRDNSIKKADELYNKNKNCVIFSLDIEKYYYNVNLNYEKLNFYPDNKVFSNLFNILKLIHLHYRNKVIKYLDKRCQGNNFLPIGLQSSGLIANWYLKDFDIFVKDKLKAAYYGRYVDDILCVFENKTKITKDDELIEHFFNQNNLFTKQILNEQDILYSFALENLTSLRIQKTKIKIFLIDASSSKTILERFKKDIEANSSEFRFLPSFKTIDEEFSSKMFNLNYCGSSNIMRNIDKYVLNRYNLSVYLSKKIKLAFYVQEANEKYKDDFLEILKKEIKGYYLIELYDYWYKIFEYLLIKGYSKEFKELYSNIKNHYIRKIQYLEKNKTNQKIINARLKLNLQEYLFNAVSLAFSLNPKKDFKFEHYNDRLIQSVKKYRKSNLIDNNRIFIPLYNYTKQYYTNMETARELSDFRNLLAFNYNDLILEDFELQEDYLNLSPINIYLSKKELFKIHKELIFGKCNQIETYSRINNQNIEPEAHTGYNGSINVFNFSIPVNEEDINKTRLKIGLTNFSINESDVKNIDKIDLSDEKFEKIRNLLEYAQKKSCDLVLFPEITIPFQWISLFFEEAKLKNIGIVGGLKHFTNKENCCYNTLCTILPYRANGLYRDAFIRLRVKNNYSPKEQDVIKKLKYNVPSTDIRNYDLFLWKNTYFSSYNCFEIASIEDRSLFKGKVDFITLNAYNQDTSYFNNIINSTARDLHCCVAHVNNSEFGYSCISLPKETYEAMPVIVKGGNDDLVITYNFDYTELRKFQENYLDNKLMDKEKKKYKVLPPNFKISEGRKT